MLCCGVGGVLQCVHVIGVDVACGVVVWCRACIVCVCVCAARVVRVVRVARVARVVRVVRAVLPHTIPVLSPLPLWSLHRRYLPRRYLLNARLRCAGTHCYTPLRTVTHRYALLCTVDLEVATLPTVTHCYTPFRPTGWTTDVPLPSVAYRYTSLPYRSGRRVGRRA